MPKIYPPVGKSGPLMWSVNSSSMDISELSKRAFNPDKSSPNIFMRKLESRLKQYYNLLSARNSRKKK